MTREKTPQERAANRVVRELAPVVGHRTLTDGDDLVVFVTVRKPSRKLLAYRVHPDATVDPVVEYRLGVNAGFKLAPHGDSYNARPRSGAGVTRGLPKFRDLAEAVRFLADFPAVKTGDPAIVHVIDRAVGSLGGLGSVIETERYGRFDREGLAVSGAPSTIRDTDYEPKGANMNPNVDETLARDIAEDAVELFEARGKIGRIEYVVRESAARIAEGKTEPPNDDEIGRAYGLAVRAVGARLDPKGAELHPDGSRRESDREIVDGIFGRWTGR